MVSWVKLKKMKKIIIYSALLFVFGGCSLINPLSKYPEEDRPVYKLTEQVRKANNTAATDQLEQQYQNAVKSHLQKIEAYKNSTEAHRGEKIMKEYAELNSLADEVSNSTKKVKVKRFDAEYALAKEELTEDYYRHAQSLLQTDDRNDAKEAYTLLKKVNSIAPNYRNANELLEKAYNKSILTIVVNPVNYYARSYNYWGLNNDYVQQEIARDLGFRLGQSDNVKVLTDYEARSSNRQPDRIIDLSWNELFLPIPESNTYSRQVSKTIVTGKTADNKPVYGTVYATVYVTRVFNRSRGTLDVKISDPSSGKTILWDNFPVNNNTAKEYATYRGDSRALSSYDWALLNRGAFNNPSRYQMFDNIYRQVYPQLISRIRSITW